MIKITGERLTLALSVMKTFVPESQIQIQKDNLFFAAIDTANVGLVECKVAAVCDEEKIVAIQFDDFPSVMSGDVTIDVGNPLVAHIGRANYKIKTLTGVRPAPSPKIPWTNIFTMNPTDLKFGIQTVCDAYERKDTSAAVRITYSPEGLVFEDMKAELVDITYKHDELTIRKEDVPKVTTLVPADYLKQIQPIVGRLQECIVGMGKDMPITISGNAAGLGCGWIISERLDV
jgi:hypothetical protein